MVAGQRRVWAVAVRSGLARFGEAVAVGEELGQLGGQVGGEPPAALPGPEPPRRPALRR